MSILTPYEVSIRYNLYADGWNDAEIARMLGMGVQGSWTIKCWRKREGLETKSDNMPCAERCTLTVREHRERISLYNRGMSDKQIGARLDLHPMTIHAWRRKNDLPVHGLQSKI